MNEADESDGIASYMPGENVCVLYLNTEETYEDSLIISSKFADLGGFATTSICRYALPYGDLVPNVGDTMCTFVFPWWKGPCLKYCQHTLAWIGKHRHKKNVGREHTGICTNKKQSKSGEWSIEISSFQQIQTGDKVTTGHGQKGVATIKPVHSMPFIKTKEGDTIVPDLVVAMSSITTRQTNGQLYETQCGIDALRNSAIFMFKDDPYPQSFDEGYVYDGETGDLFTTLFAGGSDEITVASYGYLRMFNQTQMTRERHFTSHRSPGKYSLRTPVRRSKGGGVALGEMEVQVGIASGLANCMREIVMRGDQVLTHVCTQCKRLRLLCTCEQTEPSVLTRVPYDVILVDCTSAILSNSSFVYDIQPN